jgi:hypothetical protein
MIYPGSFLACCLILELLCSLLHQKRNNLTAHVVDYNWSISVIIIATNVIHVHSLYNILERLMDKLIR